MKLACALVLAFSSLANASWNDTFLPKNSMTCRDPNGQAVRLSAHVQVTRAGGHIYHRQIVEMGGQSYESLYVVIPSQKWGSAIGSNDDSPKLYFRFIPARSWRKEGYDYDPGDLDAKVWFMRGSEFYRPSLILRDCR